MIRRCEALYAGDQTPVCGRVYDDTKSWTICPHNPLDVAADAVYCRRCDLFVGYDNTRGRVGLSHEEETVRCHGCGRTVSEVLAAGDAGPASLDSASPLCSWWISFTDASGRFQGAAVVESPIGEPVKALERCTALGINPGGAAQTINLPRASAATIPASHRNRLLSDEESRGLDAHPAVPTKVVPFKVLPPAEGLCKECARGHEPDEAHDAQSLVYQYTFFARGGRWPTWRDAVAHCDPVVRGAWIEKLREHGAWLAEWDVET